MGLLLLLAIIGIVIYASSRGKGQNTGTVDLQLTERNKAWASFIAGYSRVVKTKTEKHLIARMLSDIKAQNLVDPSFLADLEVQQDQDVRSSSKDVEALSPVTKDAQQVTGYDEVAQPDQDIKTKTALSYKLDNISLLLYFGAFLFVASIGLFVSFAQTSGELRTLAVLMLTLVMYGTGVWLFRNKKALQPAGLAFAGIGVAIAPLTGLAAYNYILTDNASAVWFATSLLCLGLYAHAVFVLRKPLINYVFIFTFLSLFESSVSILNVPVFYFGWAMAGFGILLQLLSIWKNFWPELRESSRTSARIFLPLALFASFAMVGREGVGQFGVSLALVSIFYLLEAINSINMSLKETYYAVAHIAALSSIGCIAYSLSSSLLVAGCVISAISLVESMIVLSIKTQSSIIYNFASITIVGSVVSLLLIATNAKALFVGIICSSLCAAIIWYKQNRPDAYAVAGIGWVVLPLVFGQRVIEPHLSVTNQTWLVMIGLFIHLGVFISIITRDRYASVHATARAILLLQVITGVGLAFNVSPSLSLALFCLIGVMMFPLSVFDKGDNWGIVSGVVVALSVVSCWYKPDLLPIAMLLSLAYNVLLALRFRSEPNRWLSTLLWLLIPIGLGGLMTNNSWSSEKYAWAYVLVMIGLIISRAIARGVIFTSNKIPLSAYAKSASLSYVFGYVTAGILAVGVSAFSSHSQIHTTAILAFMSAATFVIGVYVEKRPDISALQPVFFQVILLSIVRPSFGAGSMQVFLLFSTALAGLCYAVSSMLCADQRYKLYVNGSALQISLATAFIVPATRLFSSSGAVWQMPFGLAISGVILYDYVHNKSQEYRELASSVVIVSVLWFMYYFGVRELQAFTHIIALSFGAFAYWRNTQGDRKNSDAYLYCMLAVASVPLALQAISGASGGLYGWWLLLEQVVFMLLGIAIRRKFVVLWGLYLAIASVLYQLRNLGWAALTVLAVFVIGVAIYQLQKYNKPDQ